MKKSGMSTDNLPVIGVAQDALDALEQWRLKHPTVKPNGEGLQGNRMSFQ